MKIRRPGKVWFILLIFAIFLNPSCTTIEAPKVTAPRLGNIESFTYANYYEEEKRYDKLLSLLKKELAAIQMMELYAKVGIELTEYEKQLITKVMQREGSKDPIGDFLKKNRLTPDSGDYDPEGKLFLLDSIAHTYTYGLVDFKKAQDYNEKARLLYDKFLTSKNENVSDSVFYNNRRHLYFFKDFGYDLDEQILNDVQKLDVEKTGLRIRKRSEFLASKLGDGHESRITESLEHRKDCSKLIEQMELFIKNNSQYDAFLSNYLLASEAYKSFMQNNEPFLLSNIIGYSENAIRSQDGNSPQIQNRLNSLYYWLGFSHLKLGRHKEGIRFMEKFLTGIDEYENLIIEADKHRNEVVQKVNEERIRAAKIKAGLAVALTVLYVAASVAASNIQASSPNTYRTGVDTFGNILQASSDAAQWLAGVRSAYLSEQHKVEFRKEVAKYLTPYSLKVNRYLNKHEMVEYFIALGKAYNKAGSSEKALMHFEEAINMVERQRTTIFTEGQRISFFGTKQDLYRNIIQTSVSLKDNNKAIEFVERSKSRAFVDMMGSSRVRLKSRDQTKRYNSTILNQVELDTIVSSKSIGTDQIGNIYSKTERALAIMEKEEFVSNVNPEIELTSLSSVRTLTADEIKVLPDTNTAILEYYLTKEKLYIFIINNGTIHAESVTIDSEQIITDANIWREMIYAHKDDNNKARYFYDLLISHVKDRITAEELIIIPHGVLHYIPFQALFDGKQFLAERFAISYAPSITILDITKKKQSIDNRKALIVGNPTMDLTFAEEEAVNISKLFDEKTLLLRSQATESFIKNNGEDYEYIHLATHSLYDEQKPLRSMILLGPDTENDGKLTASELFSTQWNASLVTLSACESGLSKNLTGDELIGLQRGLMFAGTRSIVSSLWKVDDEATSLIMNEFYKNLLSMPKNKALQRAQLVTMEKYPDPFYWAAFCLTGSKK